MIGPVDALRKIRASRLRERPARQLDPVEIAVFLVLGGLAVAAWWSLPFARYRSRGQMRMSIWVLLVLLVPTMLAGAAIVRAYRRLRTRGVVPFAFPLALPLSRWRILDRDGDAALVLTDTEGVMCLFVRPEAGEPLEQVLDDIDPDNELVVDEDVSNETTLRFELEGARPAHGLLRRCDDRSYVLVLVPPARLDDLSSILAKARPRAPGEPPQKWRSLSATDVIVAKPTHPRA